VILVTLDSKPAQYLLALTEGDRVTIQNNAKRFCDAVRKAGKKAFPRMRTSISPYSLRHAVAASLKASGIDADGIAQVLGHRASRSQQVYGMRSQRSNNVSSILGVRASLPVRNTKRSPIGIGGIGGATTKPRFS
jgi:site-specific recombinase XerD